MLLLFLAMAGHAHARECLVGVQSTSDAPRAQPVYQASLAIQAPRLRVMAALSDIPAISTWLLLTKNVELVPPLAGQKPLVHMILVGVGGRQQDLVLVPEVYAHDQGRTIHFCLRSAPELQPQSDSIYRIKDATVEWVVSSLNAGTTQVTLRVQVTPAVNIPFFMRPLLNQVPERSLMAFAQRVQQVKYAHPEVFIRAVDHYGFFDKVLPGAE